MQKGAWRCKKSRRRVAELKAKRQALREEGAAIMVQSSWRCRKARRRVNQLKLEKQRLLEEASALLVQSRWRIIQAKRRVSGLRAQRIERIRVENKSATSIANRVRRYIAMKLLYRLQRSYGYLIMVTYKNASDVNIADINTSDPYVVTLGT
jgi:hypothetical protein